MSYSDVIALKDVHVYYGGSHVLRGMNLLFVSCGKCSSSEVPCSYSTKNAIKIKNSAPNDRGILNCTILSVIGSKKYANKIPIMKGLKISLNK